jgi:hypothetical protein
MQTDEKKKITIQEPTSHTAQTSPKVKSFHNHPLDPQRETPHKLRVFSNPKSTSSTQGTALPLVDWSRIRKTIEEEGLQLPKPPVQRGYRMTLISGLPTSKKGREVAK